MKKAFAVFLCAVFVFCLSAPPSAASEAADAARTVTFSVSIYNDLTGEYLLEHQMFTTNGVTVFRTVNLLKAEGRIADFTQSEAELLELRYYLPLEGEETAFEETPEDASASSEAEQRETMLLRANDVERFYVKRNGELVTGDALNRYMRDGDMIEWIYGEPPEPPEETSPQPEQDTRAPAEFWTEEAEAALDEAAEWLNLHPDTGTLYLAALGSAGKTADMKTIAAVFASIHGGETGDTAEALAKLVLSLSYCGYDRNDEDMASLMSRLTSCPLEEGLYARVYPLIAYDSRSYTIPNAAENNRQALISGILSFQQPDGGFAESERGVSGVEATALAITALSRYQDQSGVAAAVEKGVSYLSSVQLESGGFRSRGQAGSQGVSMTITALCALNVNLSRFSKGERSLVDVLLQYREPDGGFARTAGGVSDMEATEFALLALAAVKRNGDPYLVPVSLTASVPAASPQANPQEEPVHTPRPILYLVIGCVCLLVFAVLLAILIHNLRSHRSSGQEDGEDLQE